MKSIIIKWNPLHSSVSMSKLLDYIKRLKTGGPISPCWEKIHLPEEFSNDTRFYLLKYGYSQNGIFASGIISNMDNHMHSHVKALDCDHSCECYAELHIDHFINPCTLPIMPIADFSSALPSYNWNNEENFILSEKDSEVMEDLWVFYLTKTQDLTTSRENALDCFYCDNHISLEKPSTYTAKDILIKWAPRTSALKKEDVEKFRQRQKTFHSLNEDNIPWYWPMANPTTFSRYDRIFVVLQTATESGLFFAGNVRSLPHDYSKIKDDKAWLFCDPICYIDPFKFPHVQISKEIHYQLEDIAIIVPELTMEDIDQEIILTRQQGNLLVKLLKPDYIDCNYLPF